MITHVTPTLTQASVRQEAASVCEQLVPCLCAFEERVSGADASWMRAAVYSAYALLAQVRKWACECECG